MTTFSDLILSGLNTLQSNDSQDIRNALNNIISQGNWQPCCDIIDNKDMILIYMDLPGVNKDDIEVDFFNNKLSITGKRVKKYFGNPIEKGICYGSFTRNITLPLSVTGRDTVDVSYEDGVLVVSIDKRKEKKNKFKIKLGDNSKDNHTVGDASISYVTTPK